ncbi:MAG: NUDIX hydrolase [Tepidisphaeraceae bacterium]
MDEKVIEKQVLYAGKKVRLELHHLRLADGTRHTREVCVHPGAAVILPILPDGKVLLIRTLRYGIREYLLELPAGTLEAGESPMNCAGRELIEETNYVAGKLRRLTSFYSSPGILTENLHVFLATDLLPQAGQKDEGEEIELMPMTLAEAIDAIGHGQIVDGKTIASLLFYERFHERFHGSGQ